MCGMVRIGGKLLGIHEAAKKVNDIGLAAGDFSEAIPIFSLEFPSEAAITNGDVYECSIRFSSQELSETEISKAEAI
ncbi:MAG: hypothetical protein WB392_15490 [Methanotrichaceae archaeon]